MILGRNQPASRHLFRLFQMGTVGDLTDGQLLERFAAGGGESAGSAFDALVERHGPMVMRVCRRALGDLHDAEDAFQATFLILVKKANTVRKSDSVASWLHGVALRVSAEARAAAVRRRRHEGRGAEMAARSADGRPASVEESLDLALVLEEEVGRLSEKYRAPVVLCHLEGLTHEEAAERLRWPVGTVRSRLARARDRLRSRLVRRGLTPSAVLPAVSKAPPVQAVSAALIDQTVKTAARIVAGEAMTVGMVPASVASLIRGGLRHMFLNQLKITASALLAFGIIGAGTLAMAMPGLEVGRQEPTPAKTVGRQEPAPSKVVAPLPTRAEVRDALKSWWEGMKTLEFRERTTYLEPDGRKKKGSPDGVVEYAHAPGNRRLVRHGAINAEGVESYAQERRFDGRNHFYILADGKFPSEITTFEVSKQTDTRDFYEGEMSDVLWLIMFLDVRAGRPLYQFIDWGNPMVISRDAAGQPKVILIIDHGGPVAIELDPDHGWLPRKVGQITSVTKFAKDNGVWFPVEGVSPGRDREGASTFQVVGLRINRPIADDRFTFPHDQKTKAVELKPGR